MQTQTKTFKVSSLLPSLCGFGELNSVHQVFAAITFTYWSSSLAPSSIVWKQQETSQRRAALVTWEFACNHPTLDYQRAVWDGYWQPWLVFGYWGIFSVLGRHSMRSCRQVPKSEMKNTEPGTRREEEWAGWHGLRQTLRRRRCYLFPRQGRWMLEDWTNSQAPASWRSSVSESFLGKPPLSLWNWKAKGSSEESRSSFRRHTVVILAPRRQRQEDGAFLGYVERSCLSLPLQK